MAQELYEKSPDRPIAAPAPVTLRASAPPNVARAARPVEALRPFSDEGATSRLPALGDARERQLKWKTALRPDWRPRAVLASGERALVVGAPFFALLDLAGHGLATDELAAGDVTIDAAARLFYLVKSSGKLGARSLDDGAERFNVGLFLGSRLRRDLIAREGSRLTTVSVERPLGAEAVVPPRLTIVEAIDLGDPPRLNKWSSVISLQPVARLKLDTVDVLAARRGELLVLAAPGRVWFLSAALKPQDVVSGDFSVRALSVDEAGAVHALVELHDGARRLWSFAAGGARWCDAPVPAGALVAPPIVGYDHRLYLAFADRVLAFERDGRPRWQHELPERVAGAAVTSDGWLLVSTGDAVIALDEAGQARTLARADRPLVTPPTLTAAGLLLVASTDRLFAF